MKASRTNELVLDEIRALEEIFFNLVFQEHLGGFHNP